MIFAEIQLTDFIRASLGWLLFWFLPVALLTTAAYFLTTLPARRKEKVRLFLDLLLTSIREGHSPEHTIVRISETRERSLGARFHLVAAYIEEGASLVKAIKSVPGYVPPGVIGFLETGASTNRMEAALIAGKESLGGSLGRTGTAMHYAFVLVILMMPFALIFLPFWQVFIWPKFQQIFADMEVPMPWFTTFVTENVGVFTLVYAGMAVTFGLLFYVYLAAPRLFKNKSSWIGILLDRILYVIPWRRKRAQRDFSVALSLLLEANTPEASALHCAGEATGNRFLASKARRVSERIASGLALPHAIRFLDESGEFEWRLQTAAKAGGSFLRSLRAWHEVLEAEAWRAEEMTAHFISASLIICNGLFVGTIIASVFLAFIAMINEAALW